MSYTGFIPAGTMLVLQEKIERAHPKHPNYPLLPGDHLVKDEDGTFYKFGSGTRNPRVRPHSRSGVSAPSERRGDLRNGEPLMSDYFLTFHVVGHPEPAGSKTAYTPRPGMRPVVVDANKKAKPWKNVVAATARGAMLKERWETLEGACWLSVAFFIERPKSHFRVNGELSLEGVRHPFPAKKPDALKLARAVEDALTDAGVYRDDALIVSEVILKQWGVEEGVTVTVMAL